MTWTKIIDTLASDQPTFSNAEVRAIILRALELSTDNWVNRRRT